METDIREVRPSEPIAGIGGFIEFRWRAATDKVLSRIEIREWSIVHEYINARLAMSGGLGSIQYDRVADGFEFSVIANMDLRTTRAQPPGPGSSANPFYDARMEGSPSQEFKIGIHFQCGDSTFWDNPHQNTIARPAEKYHPLGPFRSGIYQTCDEVTLDEVTLVDSSRGKAEKGVLRYLIRGNGSKPLQRWVGDVWCGGGAFGVTKALQVP